MERPAARVVLDRSLNDLLSPLTHSVKLVYSTLNIIPRERPKIEGEDPHSEDDVGGYASDKINSTRPVPVHRYSSFC